MDPHFKASIDGGIFGRVAIAQSKDPARPNINGVFVTPHASKGALLIATDGHCMLVAYDAGATVEGGEAIIALPKDCLRLCQDGSTLHLDGDKAEIVTAKGAALMCRNVLVDGTFPEWRRVLPALTPAADSRPGVYNADILARLGKALSVSSPFLTINAAGPLDPALVFGYYEHAFGVIMPSRNGPEPVLPAWLD